MNPPTANAELLETRDRVAARVRALRKARHWTQAELGHKLGLSQARLSEIERGKGSFTAEQLIALLHLFNVDIGEFLPPANVDDELQNALIRHGATHLREVPGLTPSGRFRAPADLILAVLLDPRNTRFVTALGPVLVSQVDAVSFPALEERISASGRSARLGWLIENVRDALLLAPPEGRQEWRRRTRRALTVLTNELDRFKPPPLPPDSSPDLFDSTIRSVHSLDTIWNHSASEISRRWGIATEIQPLDFVIPIRRADEPD